MALTFSAAFWQATAVAEENRDEYSSFNIYVHTGDNNNDGTCGEGLVFDPDDCWVESIFDSKDDKKKFSKKAIFLGNQFTMLNENILSISIRRVNSKNYENNNVYSFAYVVKNFNPFDLRLNISKGFRTPAIKELYYNFQGHDPPIIGNPNLKPTTNNYISFSIDRRGFNQSYSLETFYNKISNMIGIRSATNNIGDNILLYDNFDKVKISGLNFHYEKDFNIKHKLKFVYNYTSPKSDNKEALELNSKNAFRINYIYKPIKHKLKILCNIKYAGEKFIFDGDTKVILEDYYLVDILAILNISNYLEIKFGRKNLNNYLDDRRLIDDAYFRDILSSYDPGSRYVFEVKLSL